jgi:flavodoxin
VNELKVLVTYFSNTGNTEKVAQSIKNGLEGQNVDLRPVKEVEPSSLKEFDIIFLGSGIYASRVNKSLSDLINTTQELPQNFVFFCTHASADSYQDGFKLVKRALKKSGSNILGEFDCCGDNLGIPEATRNSMLEKLPPEKRKEAEKYQQWLKGRPNDEDLMKAKEFAQSVIKKL